jgi:hypothetical protein
LDAVAGQNGLSLDRNLLLERGMATPVDYEVTGRINELLWWVPPTCTGWLSTFQKSASLLPIQGLSLLAGILKKLENLKLDIGNTVVLDLLSNTAYMGTDVHALPSPAERAGEGRYCTTSLAH